MTSIACSSPIAPTPVHEPFARCGGCPGCRAHRVLQWKSRILLEAAGQGVWPLFFTMTYSNDNLPTLDESVRFPQLMWKRLRNEDWTVRYFCATEFGTTTNRLHHHAIVWLSGRALPPNRELLRLFLSCWTWGRFDWSWIRSKAGLGYAAKYAQKGGKYSFSRSLGDHKIRHWRSYVGRRHARLKYPNQKAVPAFINCLVLNKRTDVIIPERIFRATCLELGVSAEKPDLTSVMRSVIMGAPTGPTNRKRVWQRVDAQKK